MLRFKWAIGAVAVLCAVLNPGRAAEDDETFDLRGPAPEKGQVFVSKSTFTISDAETTLKAAGGTLTLKTKLVVTSEEEAKVLAVKDRDVTRCQVKVLKDQTETTAALGGEEEKHTERGKLEKETIISERDGKAWKHVLVDTKPSDDQKKELDNREGIENDDDLYPEDKVKVGHKWTVDAPVAIKKLFGNTFTDVKGKFTQTFTKVEDLNGESVAVIESVAKVTAKVKEDGEPNGDAELDLKITTWKSLKTGLAVKEKFAGKIKTSGTTKVDDVKTEMTVSGTVSGEASTKLK